MKNLLLIIIISIHLFILAKRLPDWKNDKSIWVAAVKIEPLDPWNLNNAAHFTQDERSTFWLVQFMTLSIPSWLSYKEREPYILGTIGLVDSLKASGFVLESDKANNKLNELIIDHKIVVGYVTK